MTLMPAIRTSIAVSRGSRAAAWNLPGQPVPDGASWEPRFPRYLTVVQSGRGERLDLGDFPLPCA